MNKLNVLSLVSYNFLPAKMGGQKNIALHNQYLSTHVNLIAVSTKSNDISLVNYKVYNIVSNSFFRYINVFYFFTIRRIIIEHKISHVIIEHPYYGWLAFLLQKFCKIKLIIHSHNIEAIRFKTLNKSWWKILWFYEKWVHQIADFSLFITEEDKFYAENNYSITENKSDIITYGIEIDQSPSIEEKLNCSQIIRKKHQINSDEKILLFNGTLDYLPNIIAIETIVNNINSILIANESFKYKIIICGKNLPKELENIEHEKNIIYAGFVDDIAVYFKAADIFINPVIEGGGIKTKVVEALGYNLSVVSYKSGSLGIDINVTLNKLHIVNDAQVSDFASAVMNLDISINTPESFYKVYNWKYIAQKTYNILKQP